MFAGLSGDDLAMAAGERRKIRSIDSIPFDSSVEGVMYRNVLMLDPFPDGESGGNAWRCGLGSVEGVANLGKHGV